MENWEKAGRIAGEALEFGKGLVKVDASLLEVAEKIEEKITSLGGKPAFPVNLSINQIAAHYTPYPEDKTIFKENEVVKIDVGVHVEGAIGDTACTVDLGSNKELVEASNKALNEALKMFTPGTKIGEIGRTIQRTIQEYKLTPIVNLSGHLVEEYKLHAGLTIPNYDNGDKTTLEEGQVFAVEPFATNGEGKITEGRPSGIYRLNNVRQVRDPKIRKIIQFIAEEYKELPFAKRWIVKKFPNANFALALLENQGILNQYPQLPERTKGLVSQAEHTVVVNEKPKITTRI